MEYITICPICETLNDIDNEFCTNSWCRFDFKLFDSKLAMKKNEANFIKNRLLVLLQLCNPNIDKKYRGEALVNAAMHGKMLNISYLLNKGVNIDYQSATYEYSTALMVAAESNKLNIVEYLVKNGADINAINSYEYNALLCACKFDSLEVLKYLHELGSSYEITIETNYSALMVASEFKSINIVKHLLLEQVFINAQAWDGITALMLAACQGNFEIVKLLIEAGANINIKSKDDLTALIFARHYNRTDIIEYLLENSADSVESTLSESQKNKIIQVYDGIEDFIGK